MSAQGDAAAQLVLLDDALAGTGTWRVRPSERARRLAVRVLPGGTVEIVVPRGTRPRTVEQFVVRHRRWIERKLDQYRPLDPEGPDRLPAEVHFPASGARWRLACIDTPGPPRLGARGDVLELAGDPSRPALLRHALQRFAMHEAHALFEPWLANLSAASGLGFRRLQVRRQRTRWGSCSRSGTISLNVCLLFQPPAVVNYLLVHELAHTRHMDHSRRFWSLVASLEPNWRELDRALEQGWRLVPRWALDPGA